MLKKFSKILIILGCSLWGCTNLFVISLSKLCINSIEIAAIRTSIATPLFVIITLCVDKSLFKFKLKDIWIFIVLGILSSIIFNSSYSYSIINSTPLIAAALIYTSPLFVALEAYFIFREKFTIMNLFSLTITLTGCILIIYSSIKTINIPIYSVIFSGLLASISYATFIVITKFAATKYHFLTITMYTFIFGSIIIAPFCNLKKIITQLSLNSHYIPVAFNMSLICSFIANLCFSYGLKNTNIAYAAVLSTSELIIITLINTYMLNNDINLNIIIGIIAIILSIIIQNIHK